LDKTFFHTVCSRCYKHKNCSSAEGRKFDCQCP